MHKYIFLNHPSRYLGCVSEHMKQLKPFGDVPEKLTGQIKRSFVATRTFEQALGSAADIAKNMVNVKPASECVAALTKMQQCGTCSGHAEKPCSNYCVNVMKGCLNHYQELDMEWDNFVGSMERISERLLGPFNIVVVVEPINIKISEAIMNFQVKFNLNMFRKLRSRRTRHRLNATHIASRTHSNFKAKSTAPHVNRSGVFFIN